MRHVSRAGDLLYATVFGLIVALGVWAGAAELVAAATTEGEGSRQGWAIMALAVGVCSGIAAGWAVRFHRRRKAATSPSPPTSTG